MSRPETRDGGVALAWSASVSEQQRLAALSHAPLAAWIEALDRGFDLRGVLVRDVVMFGPRAGFVLAEAEVYDHAGRRLPGIAFLRGGSVAVLPVLVAPDGERHAVLVRQARPAIGDPAWHETPAGMLDGGGFVSKALEELAEEVGADIAISEGDLVHAGDLYPSPGACDEVIRVYVAEVAVAPGVAAALTGRETGNAHESEAITVVAVPLADVPAVAGGDMKTMLAWRFHDEALRTGAMPEPRSPAVP